MHYGGCAWRSDGNAGNHYMVQGALMWHVQALKNDGGLEYGNLLLPAGALHPHVHAHQPTHHHAQHLHRKASKKLTAIGPRAVEPLHFTVTSHIVAPEATQAPSFAEQGRHNPVEAWDSFHDRHARGIMRAQGVVDIAAGTLGTFGTAGAVVLLLGPETMGLSVVLGIAALATYELFRSGTQTAAGGVEVIASFSETDKGVLETREKIDHLKTMTSVAGLATMGVARATGRGNGWEQGLIASDVEAVATGFLIPDPFEEVFPLARLSRAASASKAQQLTYRAYQAADAGDKADKIHSTATDSLHLLSTMHSFFQKKRARDNRTRPAPAAGQHS